MEQAAEKSAISTRHRRHVLTWYIILVLIWSTGGMLIWTGALKEVASHIGRTWGIILFGHFGFLTWPAHEATLCLAGRGLGANALSQISISSFVAFVVWSCILWTPLLMLRWRKTPVWLGVAAQILLALLTFAMFWSFGNA